MQSTSKHILIETNDTLHAVSRNSS